MCNHKNRIVIQNYDTISRNNKHSNNHNSTKEVGCKNRLLQISSTLTHSASSIMPVIGSV